MKTIALGLVLIGLALSASTARVEAEPKRIRIQSSFNLNAPILGETLTEFRDRMRANGPETLDWHAYGAGKLVPPLRVFDAVSSGKVEAGFSASVYWMGKLPAATVFSAIPFGPDADAYLGWLYYGGGLEIWRDIYAPYDVVPLPCGISVPEASGWFRFPVESNEDLEGLKIRFAGLGGEVLKRLGASITMLPSIDLFTSLERGVIDAPEFSVPSVDQALGFYKVANHYYFPGWHQPASILELSFHRPVWESFTDSERAAIKNTCEAMASWTLARSYSTQADSLAFFREQGVEIHSWSPEQLAQFRQVADQVFRELSAADPDFKRAYASLTAFRAKNAPWSDIAFPE